MYHNMYYKRAEKESKTYFAVTQKGTYYKILTYLIETRKNDYAYMSIQCDYGSHHTWYSEDEWENRGSNKKPIVIYEKDFIDYLNGECSDNLSCILNEVNFDSEIEKFVVIRGCDSYAFLSEGYYLGVIEITKNGPIETHLSPKDDASYATIEELNLHNNKDFLAGLSIKKANNQHHLIALGNQYIGQYGFEKKHYEEYCLEDDVARVQVMAWQKHFNTKWLENLSTQEFPLGLINNNDFPPIEILPRIGILVWEYEEDGVRLKSLPQYYFIDLNDSANINQEERDPDDEMPF